MQETWVQFLVQEDPLKKGMATHSSILAWRIPWTEVSYNPSDHKEQHFHSIIFKDLKELNWNSIASTSFVHSDASLDPLDFAFQDILLKVSDHTIMVIWVDDLFCIVLLCILATFS